MTLYNSFRFLRPPVNSVILSFHIVFYDIDPQSPKFLTTPDSNQDITTFIVGQEFEDLDIIYFTPNNLEYETFRWGEDSTVYTNYLSLDNFKNRPK